MKVNQHSKVWILYWSPEGRPIATVNALTYFEAIKKAPKPYSNYPEEMYAEIKRIESVPCI